MLVARLFSKIFKKDGVILIDYAGQKYICGNPRKEKPITVKLLKKNLNWKAKLNINETIDFVVDWYKNFKNNRINTVSITRHQIKKYMKKKL